jgi:gamma-glutamyltranspeptidase / glutathione hydrolase
VKANGGGVQHWLRKVRCAAAAIALVGAGCQRPAAALDAVAEGTAGDAVTRFAPRAMISSNEMLASEAGIEILRDGGNAVDAAVAVGFALAVTHPEAGNIGGGGFMVIRLADGRTAALDYREVAPAGATRDMFVGADGRVTDASLTGHLASGVPGAVAGMSEAHARYGRLPWARLLQPAIRLAETGFTVDSVLHRSLSGNRELIERFAGGEVFFAGNAVPPIGSTLRQPQLARTLRLIATQGPRVFYEGEIAGMIAAEMRRGGGLITREDLAGYEPVWRDPVVWSYRGHTLIGMPPVSSGGVTMAQIFNVLEELRPLPRPGSVMRAHLITEAFKGAFIDRNTLLGDPDFVEIPVARLVSRAYAREQAAQIRRDRARPVPTSVREAIEGSNTTHYSIVDAAGNAVSTTTTINDLYGSGVYVAEGGFFLNNEMDDFTARPGVPNQFGLVQGEANAVEPRKRMLSSMSPTIVLDPRGDVLLVLGARGGPRIITSVTQIVLNVLEHGMTLAEAMATPRLHHQGWPDTIYFERGALSDAAVDSLARIGQAAAPARYSGGFIGPAHAVMRVGGGWVGVVDPRTSGGAAGY